MLDNFFRINMPYGIAKNEDGAWLAFNREYLPIGFHDRKQSKALDDYKDFPVYMKYKGLTEKVLKEVAFDEKSIERNDKGEITTVWFYRDGSNPVNSPGKNKELWENYFKKLQALARLKAEYNTPLN